MPIDLLTLRESESEAAPILARRCSIHLAVMGAAREALEASGFLEAPAAIECFIRAPIALDDYPRRYRKVLRKSLEQWQARGLQLELGQVDDVERFLEDIYYPFFARAMYAKGIAPHSANTVGGMRSLLENPTRLAIVRRADRSLAGAALLGFKGRDAYRQALAGPLPTGDWQEGLIYALSEDIEACRRALPLQIAAALANEGGQKWFSLGRDLPWCELGYDAVLFEKLRLATSIVAGFDGTSHMYHFTDGAPVVLLEWVRSEECIRPRVFAPLEGRLAHIAERILTTVRLEGTHP